MIKHGFSHTPEYSIWRCMYHRCYNPKQVGYKNYGGRGIKICKKWKYSFINFFNYVGKRPSKKHSLDRMNTNLGYFPGNVKWSTDIEQARNTRRNVLVTYKGKTMCISAWVEKLGISRSLLRDRLRLGWSVERAFTEEVYSKKYIRKFHVGGKQVSAKQLSKILNCKVGSINKRIQYGWTDKEIIETPIQVRKYI